MNIYSLAKILVCLYLLTVLDTVEPQKVLSTSPYTYLNGTRYKRQSTNGGSCTLPEQPEHGKWTIVSGKGEPGETINIDTVLKFRCDVGYKLSGNEYLFCDGNWTPQKVKRECDRSCPPMHSSSTTILHCTDKYGQNINCQEATEGTFLTYNCSQFYETPLGYKKSLLCRNGRWNHPKPVCQPVCGRKVSDDTTPLIFGGVVNEVIEYPWVTAIYKKGVNVYTNICGGSIIGPRIVLTAAHCVTNGVGEVFPKQLFQVGAGKLYNGYMDARDPAPQYLPIQRIIVHPSYKGESQRFFGDLAILVTKGSFVFSKFVQPICFNDVNNIHLHPGNLGAISGWGLKEDRVPSEELRTLEIPYKHEVTCAQELPGDWGNRYNMVDKICAGFVNKSMSVCNGDSGNALAFKFENNRYYIHGIVSIGPAVRGECNIQQNSLYTKVAYHYDFIDQEISKHFIDECLLPPYPKNGKWTAGLGEFKPGDAAQGNTILEITCNRGFKLSSEFSQINCESSHTMPTCQALCPMLKLPPAINVICKNKVGQTIRCTDAKDYDTLTYFCPPKFDIPKGTNNTRLCINGSWSGPKPECVKRAIASKKNGKAKRKIKGYYWKDWDGSVPEDAFIAGRDTRGFAYIAQVYVPKTGIYIGQITPNQHEVFVSTVVEGEKPVEKSNYGVKILCTAENDLHWMVSNITRTTPLLKSGGIHFVKGGVTVMDNTVYIGKYTDGENVFIGSIHGDWRDVYYFYYSTLVPLSGFSTKYEMLATS